MRISFYLAASLGVVLFVLGLIVGNFLTPEYQQNMFVKNEMGLGNADRWVDLRYTNAMIAHHRGAILVAEQAKKSNRQEVRNLAETILANEPKLIAELYEWKKEWYDDTRKVKDPVVPNLGTVNKTFDLRFLNTVISHHEAGIQMTKEIRLKSTRTEVLDNADAVENFLKDGIGMLKDWRKQWYGV